MDRLWGDSELRASLETCLATLAPLLLGRSLSGEESEAEWVGLALGAPNNFPLGELGEELRLFLAWGGDGLRCGSLRRGLGEGDERERRGGGEVSDRPRPLSGGDRERRPPFLSTMNTGESPLRRGGDLRLLSSGEALLLRLLLGDGDIRLRRSPGGGEEAEDVRLRRLSGEGERCLGTGFLNGGGDSEPEEDDPEDDPAGASAIFCAGFSSNDPFNFLDRLGDGDSDPEEELPSSLGDDAGSIFPGLTGEGELESRCVRLTGEVTLRRGGGEGLRRGGGEAEDAVLRRLGGGDGLTGDRVRRLDSHNIKQQKQMTMVLGQIMPEA